MAKCLVIIIAALLATVYGMSQAQDNDKGENEEKLPTDYITYADTIPGFGDTIPGFKSPKSAIWLATLGTVVPIASGITLLATHNHKIPAIGLICWGSLIGPAHGYLYSGDLEHAAVGTIARVGLVGATYLLWKYVPNAEPSKDWEAEDYQDDLAGLLLIVPGIYLTSIVVDIADVKGSVREHNYDVLNRRGLAVSRYISPNPKRSDWD